MTYPIAEPHVGQRVTSTRKPGEIGTVVAVKVKRNRFDGANVVFDGAKRSIYLYLPEIQALTPDNEDGYFDGPPGYVACT